MRQHDKSEFEVQWQNSGLTGSVNTTLFFRTYGNASNRIQSQTCNDVTHIIPNLQAFLPSNAWHSCSVQASCFSFHLQHIEIQLYSATFGLFQYRYIQFDPVCPSIRGCGWLGFSLIHCRVSWLSSSRLRGA